MAVTLAVGITNWANIMYGLVKWDLFYIPPGGSLGNMIQGGPPGQAPGGIELADLGVLGSVAPGGKLVVQLYDVVTSEGSALFISSPLTGDTQAGQWTFDLSKAGQPGDVTQVFAAPNQFIFDMDIPAPAAPISVNQNGTVNVVVHSTAATNKVINVGLVITEDIPTVGQPIFSGWKYSISIAPGGSVTVPFTFIDNGIVQQGYPAYRKAEVMIVDQSDYSKLARDLIFDQAYVVYPAQTTPPAPTVGGQITPGSVTFNYGNQNSVPVPDGSSIPPGQTMTVNVGFKNTGSDTEKIGVSVAIQQPDGTFIHLGTASPSSFDSTHTGTWQGTTPVLTQVGEYTIAVVLWKDNANGTVLDQWSQSPAFTVAQSISAAGFAFLGKGTLTVSPPTNWLMIGGIVAAVGGTIAIGTLIADRRKK